jgi:hypothetical protein
MTSELLNGLSPAEAEQVLKLGTRTGDRTC